MDSLIKVDLRHFVDSVQCYLQEKLEAYSKLTGWPGLNIQVRIGVRFESDFVIEYLLIMNREFVDWIPNVGPYFRGRKIQIAYIFAESFISCFKRTLFALGLADQEVKLGSVIQGNVKYPSGIVLKITPVLALPANSYLHIHARADEGGDDEYTFKMVPK